MALLQIAETLGYVSQFFSPQWWPHFPKVPYDEPDHLIAFGRRHIVMGCLFLVVATIDHFTFFNYPMQRSIVLAKTERSHAENNKLLELAQIPGRDDLFSEFFKSQNRSKMGFTVSFLSVLSIREF